MGRVDGKIVFVPLALPGETHRVTTISDKKGFVRAESEEILETAPSSVERAEPFCPLFGKCGGCNMQHLSYEAQLKAKVDMALDTLSRQGGENLAGVFSENPIIHPSPDRGYRNRAQFHRRGDLAGFRARNSHELVPLSHCPLLTEGINHYIGRGRSGSFPSRERFTLLGDGENCWVEGIHRRAQIDLMGKKILLNPGLFFQSNLSLFPKLVEKVLAFAGDGETFIDLYSGVGVFAMFLEDRFEKGVAVESSRGALEYARMNLTKTDFYEEPVEKWVEKEARLTPDFLVVDPPRTGLSRTAREAVLALAPHRISYVSCDPVTQARDLKELTAGKYRLAGYELFDFYPHTSHMEGLAHLERCR